MHVRIEELGRELLAITDNPPEKPTAEDRAKLMKVRNAIKALAEERLSEQDDEDRKGLYCIATVEAVRQEHFWESNGNRWADEPALETQG